MDQQKATQGKDSQSGRGRKKQHGSSLKTQTLDLDSGLNGHSGLMDTATEYLGNAQTSVSGVYKNSLSYAKNNPLRAAIGAVAVGTAIGLVSVLMNRQKSSHH